MARLNFVVKFVRVSYSTALGLQAERSGHYYLSMIHLLFSENGLSWGSISLHGGLTHKKLLEAKKDFGARSYMGIYL